MNKNNNQIKASVKLQYFLKAAVHSLGEAISYRVLQWKTVMVKFLYSYSICKIDIAETSSIYATESSEFVVFTYFVDLGSWI